MQVWKLLHAARWKHRTQKSRQKSPSGHIIQLCRAISSQRRHVSTIGKKFVKQQYVFHMLHSMVNFGLLAAEIGWPVWGTPPNLNGLRILAALLHSSKVVSVSQTLRRWTEVAPYVQQGDHHVGHWPTFLVIYFKQKGKNFQGIVSICTLCIGAWKFSSE